MESVYMHEERKMRVGLYILFLIIDRRPSSHRQKRKSRPIYTSLLFVARGLHMSLHTSADIKREKRKTHSSHFGATHLASTNESSFPSIPTLMVTSFSRKLATHGVPGLD
jgi:hypothetical protein